MDKKLLLKALKSIDINKASRFGICGNVGICLSEKCGIDLHEGVLLGMLKPYFSRWPDFSGSCTYPVPHPILMPKEGYEFSVINHNMFDMTTEYGKSRCNLLDFIIAELEKEIG